MSVAKLDALLDGILSPVENERKWLLHIPYTQKSNKKAINLRWKKAKKKKILFLESKRHETNLRVKFTFHLM